MNHLQLIIKREYLTKVRNKSFIIMTFLSPVIMIGLFTLVGYLSQLNNDKVRVINVLDESGLFVSQFESTDNLKYDRLESLSLEQAKAKTEKSGDYGLLYIPENDDIDELAKSITFYSEDSPSLGTIDDIEDAIRDKANTLKLNASNYDAAKIKSLRVSVDTKLETFKGEETSKLGSGIKLVFGGAAGYLLFMFINFK